jgi:O-antigen/teichoic acid export membrane protein
LILGELGVSALGVWSLVIATTSFARVADVGAAGGLGRYVAISQAQGDAGERALVYVETALILNAALYILIGGVLYWPAWWALGHATHGGALAEARRLLPYSIAAFVLQNVTNVITSGLIGFHRSYQKSILALLTISIQAGVALTTVKLVGLRGIAMAQMVQYILMAVLGWLLVVRAARGRFRLCFPYRFRREPLKELVGFGFKLQALNMATFLFEPATKFVFSSLAGISALGVYELASRGILQVRQIVIAPAQNLTPLFAAEHHQDPARLKALYERTFVTNSAAATFAMAGMVLGAPIISFIWMKHIDPLFVAFSAIIGAGWLANIIAVPGYFVGVGTGYLRWNIAGGGATAVGGPALAAVLAWAFGPIGAAIGAMVGVGGGALLTMVQNCRHIGTRPVPPLTTYTMAFVDLRSRLQARGRRSLA